MTASSLTPFFANTTGEPQGKRFLLVSYSFPPDSSIGALRWQKLVEYGGTRGWSADVIMMDPAEADVRDDSRLRNLPVGTRLFGVGQRAHPWMEVERKIRSTIRGARGKSSRGATATSSEESVVPQAAPGGVIKLLRAARRSQLARIYYAQWEEWAGRAAVAGTTLATKCNYAFVVSSGPPQMAHEAARRIATSAGLPLVLDFRDPWTAEHSAPNDLRSRTWDALSKRFERQCVSRADLVVMNTAAAQNKLTTAYPDRTDRIITIMNGADDDVQPAAALDPRFVIAQAGGLYGGRDPRLLFRAVKQVVDRRSLTPEQLVVHFVGSTTYERTPLTQIAEEEGMLPYLISEASRPRAEALALMQRAAMLVLLPQELLHCIPGKTFELVQYRSWVLAMAPRDSATELLLRGSSAIIVDPGDVAAIANSIERTFDAFSRGERPEAINADHRFDRSRQSEKLFDALERLGSK